MSEHTPGPWSAGRPDTRTESDVYGKWVYGANDEYVAIASDDGGIGNACVANARLIAAAPDLLDACERVSGYLLALPQLDAQGHAMLRVMHAAIAKTQGLRPRGATGDQD